MVAAACAVFVVKPDTLGLKVTEDFNALLPLFLTLSSLAAAGFLYSARKTVIGIFSGVKPSTWMMVAVIALAGLVARDFFVPQIHRILYDEDIYMQIAYTLPKTGRAIFCDYWAFGECRSHFLNKEPNSFPYFMGLLYVFLGEGEAAGFIITRIAAVLAVPAVFLLAYLLTGERWAGIFSALFLALLPAHMVWSQSVSTEVFFVFVSALTLTVLAAFTRTGEKRLLAASLAILSICIQIRPESGLMIGVFGLSLVLLMSDRRKTFTSAWFNACIIGFIILSTPHFAHMYFENRVSDWGAGEDGKLGLRYIDSNLEYNIKYWLVNREHPLVFTLFALLGCVFLLLNSRSVLALLFSWFSAYLALTIVFYAGGFYSGGIGHRFAVMVSTPLVLMAGFGAGMMYKKFSGKPVLAWIALPGLIIIIGLSIVPQWEFLTNVDMQAESARVTHDFAIENPVGKDDIVLTHNPNFYIINGMNALQTRFVKNAKFKKDLEEWGGDVYMLWGYWCNSQPYRDTICKHMRENYELTAVAQVNFTDHRRWMFSLYKVDL